METTVHAGGRSSTADGSHTIFTPSSPVYASRSSCLWHAKVSSDFSGVDAVHRMGGWELQRVRGSGSCLALRLARGACSTHTRCSGFSAVH